MARTARVFALAALANLILCGQTTNVSIQVINPELRTALRVLLDRKLIYQGKPVQSSLSEQATVPARTGPFALDSGARHVVMVEAPVERVKAQFEWTPQQQPGTAWVVIRYQPGRGDAGEPPFFTVTLQKNAAALK